MTYANRYPILWLVIGHAGKNPTGVRRPQYWREHWRVLRFPVTGDFVRILTWVPSLFTHQRVWRGLCEDGLINIRTPCAIHVFRVVVEVAYFAEMTVREFGVQSPQS